MNIHVTDCLINNDNLSHNTMKKKNIYANDKCQKPNNYFSQKPPPEILNISTVFRILNYSENQIVLERSVWMSSPLLPLSARSCRSSGLQTRY